MTIQVISFGGEDIMGLMVREKNDNDKDLINSELKDLWGSEVLITPGGVYKDVNNLDGIIVENEGKFAGMILFNIQKGEMEIVEIHVKITGLGIGSQLVQKAKTIASKGKLKRLWVSTSNDNGEALKFYQEKGFSVVNIYLGFMDEVRKLKPQLPKIGMDGIPLMHQIELEILF